MSTIPNIREATIDAGVTAVREWQRGCTAELSQWEAMSLTKRGSQILQSGLRRDLDEQGRERLVRAAVGA